MPTYTCSLPPARAVATVLTAILMLGGQPSVGAAQMPSRGTASGPAAAVPGEIVDLVARGDRASAARQPAQALALYEQALQRDSMAFDALWRASRELIDLGEFEADKVVQTARYAKAEIYARRAMAQHPELADVHFHVSRAVGRTAMAARARDRVKYAVEVRAHAVEALARDPRHAGALHIVGVWNAEVMRLNGIARAFAKTFMGGGIMGTASWAEAARCLEQAVAIEPDRLVHRLDLARIYRDMGRTEDARASYRAALASPLHDANDDHYRRAAQQELEALR